MGKVSYGCEKETRSEWRGVGVKYHIQNRLGKKGSEKRWAKERLILITGE